MTEAIAEERKRCLTRALGLLARREHSRQELQTKLITKGFEPVVVDEVMEQLLAEGSLSDHRYAELYAEQRARKGYGPLRIQQELLQRGVSPPLIEQVLNAYDAQNWIEHAHFAWKKYTKTHEVYSNPVQAKLQQQRFLYSRGFEGDLIRIDMD